MKFKLPDGKEVLLNEYIKWLDNLIIKMQGKKQSK